MTEDGMTVDIPRMLIFAVSIVIVIALLAGGTLYGCSRADEQYYFLANNCVSQGGNWVAKNDYSGICIAGHK
jgi:hypothetical protein